MSAMSILPSHHAEFKSKEYWDRFFLERENKAFEWYGGYADLKHLLRAQARAATTDKILVIGCGNSNFSSDLYDDAFNNITSIDFSQLVIDEMIGKNSHRVGMQWEVVDMTCLPYPASAFDLVLDKGALDALMSDASEQSLERAAAMFDGIETILSKGGRYVCITLAEAHIFKALIYHFCNTGYWGISIDTIRSTKPSPFIPLFVTITRLLKPVVQSAPTLLVSFDTVTGATIPVPQLLTVSLAIESIPRLQEYAQKTFDMSQLRIDRFDSLDMWDTTCSTDVPRFTIMVLDIDNRQTAASDRRTCAVFFIPKGREYDFQFSSAHGLRGIAEQAHCERLFAIRCNRPHVFGDSNELQTELSPLIYSMRPWVMHSRPDELIPFMAVGEEEGWELLEHNTSLVSGEYLVEEQMVDGREDAVMRRLVFLQNQTFVQTEARLVLRPKAQSKTRGKAKGKSKGKGKEKSNKTDQNEEENEDENKEAIKPIDDFEFDHSYLDDHHRCFLASLILNPSLFRRATNAALPASRALVVGFAGGAVCMSLQRYLPLTRLTVCDLDCLAQEQIAKRFFGFRQSVRTTLLQAEGVETIRGLLQGLNTTTSEAAGSMDLLLIDADSKDTSLGMSAPPVTFVSIETLDDMHALLAPGGLLIINVVARMQSLLINTIQRVRSVFQCDNDINGMREGEKERRRGGEVYTIKASADTVNVVLVARKSGGEVLVGPPWKLLEEWLKGVSMSADPLELSELLDIIQPSTDSTS